MDKSEIALQLFSRGFNCSQSVFSVFCEDMGLSKDVALKISCGFGGGMRQGEVCGAVAGAIMALGLKYGQCDEDDKESKANTYRIVKEFNKRFIEINGSIICKELLKCDISTESGLDFAKENGLFNSICPKLIKDSVNILEEIL